MSSLQNPPWRQLPSCAKDVRARSKMAAPIRTARKHRFFIKITISQYHNIDISYIDIDIGKNAFSMTSLAAYQLSKICFVLIYLCSYSYHYTTAMMINCYDFSERPISNQSSIVVCRNHSNECVKCLHLTMMVQCTSTTMD